MAKRTKADATETNGAAPESSVNIITEKEFNKILKKANSIDAQLAESKGELGSAVANAVNDHNLHKEAFRIIRKYLKKNPDQQVAFFQNFLAYWQYAKLQEEDLFSDTGEQTEAEKEEIIQNATGQPAQQPENVVQMSGKKNGKDKNEQQGAVA